MRRSSRRWEKDRPRATSSRRPRRVPRNGPRGRRGESNPRGGGGGGGGGKIPDPAEVANPRRGAGVAREEWNFARRGTCPPTTQEAEPFLARPRLFQTPGPAG